MSLKTDTVRLFPPSNESDYKIDSLCGTGHWGAVYKAFHKQEAVAVKFIRQAAKPDSNNHALALNELRMLEISKGCQNVLQLRGWGVDLSSNKFFIALDLLDPIRVTPHNLDQVRKVAKGIFKGIAELHRKNIIHGDIKPRNCLMNAAGEGVVADLGSASYKNEKRQCPIQTAYYRDPRDFIDAPYDETIDLWGLGCTLWEFAMGKPLFGADVNGTYGDSEEEYQLELRTLHFIVQQLGMPPRTILLEGDELYSYFKPSDPGKSFRLKELPAECPLNPKPFHLTELKESCRTKNPEQTIDHFASLVGRLVTYGEKISAEDALKSPFFLYTTAHM